MTGDDCSRRAGNLHPELSALTRCFHQPSIAYRRTAGSGAFTAGQPMAKLITSERTGPHAAALRYALRTTALDRHLEQIAREAAQPSVRAAALQALINQKAAWPTGLVWKWIDKSMGVRRRVTAFDNRPLTVAPAREMLLALGVRDRSAAVRNVALTGVIQFLAGTPEARAIAAQLVADRSRAVRERAEFILRSSAA